MSPHVLVVSRDAMLLQTRQLILGAFFRTQCAGRVRDAQTLLSDYRFDLVILCYTLTEEECLQVREAAMKQKRRPAILMLAPAGTRLEESASGGSLMVEAGPYYLLKRSAELLGVDIRAKANLVEV